jgi:hypothetical protein
MSPRAVGMTRLWRRTAASLRLL